MIKHVELEVLLTVRGHEFEVMVDTAVEIEAPEWETGFTGEANLSEFVPYRVLGQQRGDRSPSRHFMLASETSANFKTVEDAVQSKIWYG